VSVYAGDYAQLYDLFYADKPYDGEAAFVDQILREHAIGPSRRLLDVACGTGQHSVRLAERGWEVLGVDQSMDMLRAAEDRSGSSSATFVQQDMRALALPRSDFDAAVCLFDSIGYGVTNEAIVATLSGIRRHLRRDGLFVVEFWHAPPMLREHEPVRVRQWETDTGTVVRISRTALDVVAQLARVEYAVYQLTPDGRYRHTREVHENRYFLVQEMQLLLRVSGFEPLRWMAGFDRTTPISEGTWHVLVLARVDGTDAS
jgi:ubiquinone/menaquinone biosynthesis C-methylase UbiE